MLTRWGGKSRYIQIETLKNRRASACRWRGLSEHAHHPPFHPFAHSPIRLLTHSLIHPLTHSSPDVFQSGGVTRIYGNCTSPQTPPPPPPLSATILLYGKRSAGHRLSTAAFLVLDCVTGDDDDDGAHA